jgi:sec-independent protein translocase protein TatA
MIPNIGGPELIILLVIVLLLFGAKRIPELAKGLGTGVREFRRGTSGANEEVEGGEKSDKSAKKNEDEEVLDRENENAGASADANSDARSGDSSGNVSSGSDAADAGEKSPSETRQEQRS